MAPKETTITTKRLAGFMVTLAAFLAVFGFVNAQVVVPAVLAKSAEQADAKVERALETHGANPHKGAVHQSQIDMVMALLQNMQRQLDRIEAGQ